MCLTQIIFHQCFFRFYCRDLKACIISRRLWALGEHQRQDDTHPHPSTSQTPRRISTFITCHELSSGFHFYWDRNVRTYNFLWQFVHWRRTSLQELSAAKSNYLRKHNRNQMTDGQIKKKNWEGENREKGIDRRRDRAYCAGHLPRTKGSISRTREPHYFLCR